ncbi:hypothetical protein [Kineosporia sp. R_H_3]|uniref:hypothetical protein n=1 Tax=Kineosporia sp. R_H_3 TaxID=1961848 RepID=UPI00117A2ED2|nr:hypothetical protein [Kineosporia sp. R_H_3]MBI4941413.1 hypothetical protein [Actinomycetota bacterium]
MTTSDVNAPARSSLRGVVRDHPWWCNALLLVATGIHGAASIKWPSANVLAPLARSDYAASANELLLGVAGLAGLASGFAGVVIVFGLQSPSHRFRRFRWAGGRSLRANWGSVMITPIIAGFSAVVGAILLGLNHMSSATWLLEATLVLLAHSCARLAWLLGALAGLVAADDDHDERESRRVSTSSLFAGHRD